MMDFRTIREFHWITWMVIVLTAMVFVLIIVAFVASMLGLSDLSQGIFPLVLSLTGLLKEAFFLILVVIAMYMGVTRIRMWIEKYLDAMLAKLDLLAAQKSEQDSSGAALAVMNGRVEQMEKKLDTIEHILVKVAE